MHLLFRTLYDFYYDRKLANKRKKKKKKAQCPKGFKPSTSLSRGIFAATEALIKSKVYISG